MVRLENRKGEILRNDSEATNMIIGPSLQDRLLKDWENSLRSDNPLDVLRALVWLGGKHWNLKDWESPDGRQYPSTDVERSAIQLNITRTMEAIQDRLKELIQSKNPWIRAAAELAIKRDDGQTSK